MRGFDPPGAGNFRRVPWVLPLTPVDVIRLTIKNSHGLHARPAARLIQSVASFHADVSMRNVSTGSDYVSARSINASRPTRQTPRYAYSSCVIRCISGLDSGPCRPLSISVTREPPSRNAGT